MSATTELAYSQSVEEIPITEPASENVDDTPIEATADEQNNSAYDFDEMDEEEEILPDALEQQREVEITLEEKPQPENISSELTQPLEENPNSEELAQDVKPDLQIIIAEDMAVIRGNSIEKNIFRKNVIAIRTLQEIEREKRPATPEELQALKEYAGFGGIPKAFDKNNPNWNREAWLLQSMLTEKEYNAARGSVLNAHYTSGELVQEIYSGLENLGFNGGTILEPSMGVGGFFGNMPDTMKDGSHLYGVELDSLTGRDLMTPDEVSHLSSERELVFVAGHRPIYGNKLRYYLQPFFTKRLAMYQEIYIREHGLEEACAKYTKSGKHDCAKCISDYKKKEAKPAIPCSTYPLYSDTVTRVLSYEDLFAVNAGEKSERDEKSLAVQLERDYEAREAAKKEAMKVSLVKKSKVEEKKPNENSEPVKRNRNVDGQVETNQGFEHAEEIKPSGNDLGGQAGTSAPEKQETAVKESVSAEECAVELEGNSLTMSFGESLLLQREYMNSWEQYTSGD